MNTLTIEDCLKLYEQGVKIEANDGKVKAFVTPKKEHINADMFFYYFLNRER